MADLESIIKGSIADISDGGDSGSEESGDGDTTESTDESSASSDTGGTEAGSGDERESATAADDVDGERGGSAEAVEGGTDDLEVEAGTTSAEDLLNEEDKTLLADLKTYGIKVKNINANNRMPYKRHLRTLVNQVKSYGDRVKGEHTTALTAVEKRAVAAEAAAKEAKEVEALALENPDRYIGILAAMHPEKWGPIAQRLQQKQQEAPAATIDTKRPGPDVKYEDGSFGYSPEQHEKLMDWVATTAETRAYDRAKKDFDARLAPIENKSKAQQDLEKRETDRANRIANDVATAYKRWGKARVESHQKAIFQYMDEHKAEKPSLEDAIAAVILPKLEADHSKVREQVLKEQNERPAAAKKGTKTATTVTEEKPSGDPVLDAIKKSVAGLKGRG